MSHHTTAHHPATVPPPSRHAMAGLIWLAVFPTLSVLNLTLGAWLQNAGVVARTFVLATVAVPIVMYGLMPLLLRTRTRLRARSALAASVTAS